MRRNEGQPIRLPLHKAAFGTAVLFLAEACGGSVPTATPTPVRTPEATPSPVPTLTATPTLEVTPSPIITPSPTPEVTPTPTLSPTAEPTPEPTPELKSPESIIDGDRNFVPADKILEQFESLTPAEKQLFVDNGSSYEKEIDNLQKNCFDKNSDFRFEVCSGKTLIYFRTYQNSGNEAIYSLSESLYNYTFNKKSGIRYNNDDKESFDKEFLGLTP